MPLFATLKLEQMCRETDSSLQRLLPDISLFAIEEWVTQVASASKVTA